MLKTGLMIKLKEFLEIHGKTKIFDVNEGMLRMHILRSKNQNKTPKEKLINYKLLRVEERLLVPGDEITEKDFIIVEFLLDELMKYYTNSIKN